jgi:formimidoylglutamate deiminase
MGLIFERALLGDGIKTDVLVELAVDGTIASVTADAPAGAHRRISGLAVPGMPNLHSHAFQRAMAGTVENGSGAPQDSFWTWRERMYQWVERLSPEEVGIVAAFAYLEMLKAGYTSVAEFHYLHRAPDGSAYAAPAAMAESVAAAAHDVGLGLTLLPALYMSRGFGQAAPLPEQRRFVLQPEELFAIVERLQAQRRPGFAVGLALHSLRAVPPDRVADVVRVFSRLAPAAPIHIHVAEQRQEVDDCLKATGHRPVEWLLQSGLLDARWCLIHATHTTPEEVAGVARANAVIGLCPTTEANLGDGLFPLESLLSAGGRFGIGTDSQVSIDPWEELRLLEYGQRLSRQRRAVARGTDGRQGGELLYGQSVRGGLQALGLPATSGLEAGAPADIVVLDLDNDAVAAPDQARLLDAYTFAPRGSAVRDVMVAGQWLVQERRHAQEDVIRSRYRAWRRGFAAA